MSSSTNNDSQYNHFHAALWPNIKRALLCLYLCVRISIISVLWRHQTNNILRFYQIRTLYTALENEIILLLSDTLSLNSIIYTNIYVFRGIIEK